MGKIVRKIAMCESTNKKSTTKATVISCISAFISMCALFASSKVAETDFSNPDSFMAALGSVAKKLSTTYSDIGIIPVIVFLALIVIYRWTYTHVVLNSDIVIKVLASVFGLFTLIGISYSEYGNSDFITANAYQFILSVYTLIGYIILYHVALKLIYFLLNKVRSYDLPAGREVHAWRKSYIIAFAVICLVWAVYIAVYYPGNIPYDGYLQLDMYFGIKPLTNHHPILTTKLIGWLVSLGKWLINYNFGVFLFVAFQSLICAAIYAYVSIYMLLLSGKKLCYWLTVIFYAAAPMWGSYSSTLGKDALYYAFFALFCTFLFQFACNSQQIGKRKILGVIVISILLVLFRSDGIYVVIPSLIALILFNRKICKKAIVVLLCVIAVNVIYTGFLVPYELGKNTENASSNPYEAFSIPFQQTARYVKTYPDEVTSKEKEAIDAVLRYDNLAERYTGDNSDPVKNYADWGATDEEFKEYLSTWFSMFFKHPGTYISATINNTFGYIYPMYRYEGLTAYKLYIMGEPLNTGELDIYYVNTDETRNGLKNIVYLVDKLPVLSLLTSCGSYTWLLLAIVGFVLKKEKRYAWLFTAPFMSLLICFASPVNAYIRYSMPLMAAAPAMLAFLLWMYGGQKIEK